MNGQKFRQIFEESFPTNLAYDWDNVGLQVGTLNKEISNILVSLDLTKDVIEEAVTLNCNLILVHHPVLFRPIKKILTETYLGSMLEQAIKNDIAIYVAHTNFDISNTGMNQNLADLLGLKNQQILEMTTETEGLGRIGTIEPMVMDDFIEQVKKTFNIESLKLIGTDNKTVKTVAISGGSGSSLLRNRNLLKADVFVTGDISYHYALDALNDGLTILDVGHNIEKLGLIRLKEYLDQELDVNICSSNVNTNPYLDK